MSRRIAVFGLVGVFFFSISVVFATDRHVPSEYPTIQDGIDACVDDDRVIIAEGSYTGYGNRDLDFGGRAITIQSTDPEDPCVVEATVIDCQGAQADPHRGFYFGSGEDANSILDGFTITNGHASSGGGIYCYNSSPTIMNCIISDNTNGRGIYCDQSDSTIKNCMIIGNVGETGGGICCETGYPTIINSTITGNSTEGCGGGIYLFRGWSALISDCTITDNTAGIAGGGVYFSDSEPTITNCTISRNTATGDYGGGIYGYRSGPIISNCIINNNAATRGGGICFRSIGFVSRDPNMTNCTINANVADKGGGIYCYERVNLTVCDCILWGDSASLYPEIYVNTWWDPQHFAISYSNVQGGLAAAYIDMDPNGTFDWGPGNIDADPCFVSGSAGDYYLSQTVAGQAVDSPCVEAGSAPAVNRGMDTYTTRTDEVTDIGIVDMGYHYPPAVLIGEPDINYDFHVDPCDLGILAADWLLCSDPCDSNVLDGDIMIDGCVDFCDFAVLADYWLKCFVTRVVTPSPANDSTDRTPSVLLSWSAGFGAVSHDVYFGTDYNDVNEADIDDPNVYMGNQTDTIYDPNGLKYETAYYWRIDEVGAKCVKKGDVWSFTMRAEPNLVGWWKFDEGSGTDANDSSGYGNHGTLYGDPNWVTGKVGSYALDFDGDGDYVQVPDDNSLTPSDGITIAFWLYNRGGQNAGIYKGYLYESSRAYYMAVLNSSRRLRLRIISPEGDPGAIESNNTVALNQWHHIAGTFDAGEAAVYIDGQLDNFSMKSITSICNDTQPLTIGGYWDDHTFVSRLNGKADDVRIYNGALTAEEIEQLYVEGLGYKAFDPYPADEATSVDPEVVLSWWPGYGAVSHDVYFGTDYNDVNDADVDDPNVYMGNRTDTSYDPCDLGYETVCYWRIDEVDDSNDRYKGDVWSFTTLAPPGQASNPNPSDLATEVSIFADLGWTAGSDATSHDVYFGTDSTPDSDEFQGNQSSTTFDTGTMDVNTTYYWRIDEKNAAGTTTGEVWSFTTWIEFDPDLGLVSWWKFDEGSGTDANDSSGNGNHGTLYGDPNWVAGKVGSYALDFDCLGDYVRVPSAPTLNIQYVTMCAWVKANDATPPDNEVILNRQMTNPGTYALLLRYNSSKWETLIRLNGSESTQRIITSDDVVTTDWTYVCATYDGDKLKLYIDAVLQADIDETDGTIDTDNPDILTIGAHPQPKAYFDGKIDDTRIYNRALAAEEIWGLYLEGMGGKASYPYPADEAVDVDPDVILSWLSGYGAVSHDVYFGTDYDNVNDADVDDPNVYMGNEEPNSWDPNGLEYETAYYWRIDEVNDSNDRCKGNIWSFTTWAEPNLNLGLVGWWKFDEGSGTDANDSSGYGNHGTLYGDPNWVTGKIGVGALDFDGDGDRVEIPDDDSLTPSDKITIAFWLYNRGGQDAGIYKRASCPSEPSSPGASRAYVMRVADSNGKLKLGIYSPGDNFDSIESDNAVALNQWHHIAGTFDEGEAVVYIDGQLDNSDTLSVSSIWNDAQPLIIGGQWEYCGEDSFVSNLNGKADDVRIYERALTAGEIEQLYQQGLE